MIRWKNQQIWYMTVRLGVCRLKTKGLLVKYTKKVWVMPILLKDKNLRVLVNPGDHDPLHVHVISGELEVKIDISGDEVCVLEKGHRHRNSTNAKHTKMALALCQENLQYLKVEARKYYV
jgi:hypothetical protein